MSKLTDGYTAMADRDFNFCEMLGYIGFRFEIPAFTKAKNQLPALEVEKNWTIANVRIYVERVIGMLRQRYSILEQTIPITFLGVSDNTTTLDKIVAVSCYLVNLSLSVVLFE